MDVPFAAQNDPVAVVTDVEFGRRWMELVEYQKMQTLTGDSFAGLFTLLACILPFAIVYFFSHFWPGREVAFFACLLSLVSAIGACVAFLARLFVNCYREFYEPTTVHGKKLTQGIDQLRALNKLGLYGGIPTDELYSRIKNF